MNSWSNISRIEQSTTKRLRDKFNKLKGDKASTGNPTCPPQVGRAKQIQYMIRDKVVNREIF